MALHSVFNKQQNKFFNCKNSTEGKRVQLSIKTMHFTIVPKTHFVPHAAWIDQAEKTLNSRVVISITYFQILPLSC